MTADIRTAAEKVRVDGSHTLTSGIRVAAQREAAAHLEAMRAARKYAPDDIEAQSDFACGYLVADRARVTPTREQIAEVVGGIRLDAAECRENYYCDEVVADHAMDIATAIRALFGEVAGDE